MQTTSMKRPDGVKNFPTPAPPVTDERLNDFKSVVTRNMVGVVACRHFRGRKLRQHDGCVRFRPRTRHPLPPVTIVQHPPITGPEAGNLPATCPSPSRNPVLTSAALATPPMRAGGRLPRRRQRLENRVRQAVERRVGRTAAPSPAGGRRYPPARLRETPSARPW